MLAVGSSSAGHGAGSAPAGAGANMAASDWPSSTILGRAEIPRRSGADSGSTSRTDPPGAASPEGGDEAPGPLRTDDGDPLSDPGPEVVECEGHAAGPGVQLVVGERSEGSRGTGLVVNGGAAAENGCAAG